MESNPVPTPGLLAIVERLVTEGVDNADRYGATSVRMPAELWDALHEWARGWFGKAFPRPVARSTAHELFAVYQREAHKTAGQMPARDRVFMASMGLAGEAGEVVDELKKVHFHRKPLDLPKLVHELGDVLWYVAELATAHDLSLQDIAHANLEKLRKRHGGETFKPHAEQKRDELQSGGVVNTRPPAEGFPPSCDLPKPGAGAFEVVVQSPRSPLSVNGQPIEPAFAASAMRDGLLDPTTVTIDGHKLVDVVNFLRHVRPFFAEACATSREHTPAERNAKSTVTCTVPVFVWDAFVNAADLLFPRGGLTGPDEERPRPNPPRPHFEQPGER